MTEPRCPGCQSPPPPLATCDACEEGYAPFVTAGACPRCALVWDRLECPTCEGWTRLELWLPDGVERRALLERLLGRRGVDWEQVLSTAKRVLGSDVGTLLAGGGAVEDDLDPLLVQRAAVLMAEEALERARRGEDELASLAPQATTAALTAEVEAARRAAEAAVDAAARALDEARRRAEAEHRRALDPVRADPEDVPWPPEPAPAEPPPAWCPGCAWQPDGQPRWSCTRDDCDEPFDMISSDARCPACHRTFAQVRCPVCGVHSPPARWRGERAVAPAAAAPLPAVEPPPSPASGVTRWLAKVLTAQLDRDDARQGTIADSVERAAGATDRALVQLGDLVGRGLAQLQAGDEGTSLVLRRDWRNVVAACDLALRRDPRRPVALAHRGCARRHLGDVEAALEDLDAALALEGLTPEGRSFTLCERALARLERHDLDRALADAREAAALKPADPRPLVLQTLVHRAREEHEKAVESADVAVRRSGSSARHLLFRADVHLGRRDSAGAVSAEADATAALERGHRTAETYATRAHARLALGRLEEARADAGRALRLDPSSVHALRIRAWARAASGDGAGALADLRRARRLDPRGDTGALAFALEAWFAGERERASRLLRRAGATGERPEYAQLWRAALLRDDGPFDVVSPRWPADLVRFARGELDAATLLERAATTDDPRSSATSRRAAALAHVGLVAERDGRAEDAARAYRDCVEAGARTQLEHLWASLRLAGVEPRAPRAAPTVAAAPPPPAAPTSSLADQLERLARLRAQGVLNDEEFALAKRRILQA